MTAITLVKWSISDYHQMISSGILSDRNCELLDGKIVEMSPEQPIHYNTTKRSVKYLEKLLINRADVRFNGPITLSNSEPEPDITIVKLPETRYNEHHPYPEDILWLIEISNTSFEKDLQIKSKIYAQDKIPEYWIINLSSKSLIVLRDPQNGTYLFQQNWKEKSIKPLAFSNLEIIVSKLY